MLPKREAQHEKREYNLEAQSPRHGAPADAAAVSGEQPCGSEHRKNAKDSGESIHEDP
jgi:hypothetical protein